MGRGPGGHPLRVLGGLTCEEESVAAPWPCSLVLGCVCFWGTAASVNPESHGLGGLRPVLRELRPQQ